VPPLENSSQAAVNNKTTPFCSDALANANLLVLLFQCSLAVQLVFISTPKKRENVGLVQRQK